MDTASLRRGSPLPTAREDDEVTPTSAYSTMRSSRRQSTHSELSIWYDAPEFDGAEEFILEDQPVEDNLGSQFSEAPSTGLASASSTSGFGSNTTSDSDSDSDSELPVDVETAATSETSPSQDQPIARRSQLPSPVVGDEGSLFAVLKKNVGKVSIAVLVPSCTTHCRVLRTLLKLRYQYHSMNLSLYCNASQRSSSITTCLHRQSLHMIPSRECVSLPPSLFLRTQIRSTGRGGKDCE